MSDASHEVAPLVLPLLIANLMGKDAAPFYVALIGGISTAVASLTGLYAGELSDQLTNRKPLIVSGYFLAGTLVGLLAYAHHWITVLLLMTGAWIGRGLVSAPRNALIADSTQPTYYGSAFGFRQACDTVGAVLGPVTVYFLADWSLHQIFLVTLIPATLSCLIIYGMVHDVPHTPTQQTFSRFPFKHSLPKAFKLFMGICLLFGCAHFNKSLVILRIQENLTTAPETALSLITILYIIRNTVQACSSYIMGAISDHVGRLIPLAIGGFGCFGVMSVMLTFNSSSYLYAATIFILSGFSTGSYVSLQKSLAADLLPENLRGTGYGVMTTLDSVASLTSSLLIAIVWSLNGAQAAFCIAALISFISIYGLLLLRSYNVR